MKPELKDALAAYVLALADDELILGHRDSEWCGHAPILEEDIAFANLALDEIGHAAVWYGVLADLLGENIEIYPDELVYRRDASAFRCAEFVELPKGDWAFSMLRQYLFDTAEKLRLEMMLDSKYQPIAEAATKMRAEEIYHLRHTSAWVKRLGLGTGESNRRMQKALDALCPYALQWLEPLPNEEMLVEAHYVPDPAALRADWINNITAHLSEAGLTIHKTAELPDSSREHHSDHLASLVAELQQVSRLYPDARW